jgi:hypothetical protein
MPRSGTHAHFQFYQIVIICSLSSYIVHVVYFVFMCVGNFSTSLQPLQVYVRLSHVVTPYVNNCISQSHPLTFTFRVPTFGSTLSLPLPYFGTVNR